MTVVTATPARWKSWKKGTASALHMHLQRLGRELSAYAYRHSSEVALHESMGRVLSAAGFEFERERILDKENRADFYFPGTGIVIEVKVHGSLSEALRQVDRYLHLDQVKAVLLVGTQRWADSPLPERTAWQEKPFHLIRLRRQTL